MKAWAKSEGYWCRGGPNVGFRWSLSAEFRGWEGQNPEGKVERTSQLRVVLEMIYSRGLAFDCQSLGWNNRVDLLQGTGDQKVEGAENYLSEPRIRSPGTGVRGIVNFRVGAWNWTRVLCRDPHCWIISLTPQSQRSLKTWLMNLNLKENFIWLYLDHSDNI